MARAVAPSRRPTGRTTRRPTTPGPSAPAGSLSSHVYDAILGRILSGKLPPGQAFNRRQVAAELGVSVAPVLEAMLELQSERLIESAPRRGTTVRRPTLDDVYGQLMLREALECQAARLYCGKPVESHLKELSRLARAIDSAEILSADHCRDEVRFHHMLVSLAGIDELTRAFERVMKLGLLFSIQMLHPDPISATRASHEVLLDQLVIPNPDRADAAIRTHTRSGKEPLLRLVTATQVPTTTSSLAAPAWLR